MEMKDSWIVFWQLVQDLKILFLRYGQCCTIFVNIEVVSFAADLMAKRGMA